MHQPGVSGWVQKVERKQTEGYKCLMRDTIIEKR